MLKLWETHRQTDRQTDTQTGQKQYAAVSKERWHIVFGLSVCLCVCLSPITLTFATTFKI